MFVVPSWAVHEHINGSNDERAILFSIQDTPVAPGARQIPRGGVH
jgi:gentisate 1,2-dioxygenase